MLKGSGNLAKTVGPAKHASLDALLLLMLLYILLFRHPS